MNKTDNFSIIIAGDFFVSDEYSGKNLIDSSVENLFSKSDFNIVNQEAPITINNPKHKILKTGPHLCTNSETSIPFLKQLNIDLVTLANNHILDYGSEGLDDTFKSLDANRIDYIGAGKNLKDAAKPFTIEKDGLRIAIFNFAENEWASAAKNKSGSNPLDIIDNINQIKEAKQKHDKVIVIIHGGHEYYHLPSPRMVKQYRFYAENGASVIVGHHPHCISGFEIHKGTPIFYSLGNFLFTMNSRYDVWYTGLVLKFKFDINCSIGWELISVRQKKDDFKLELLKENKKNEVLFEVEKYSKIISDESQLTQHWNKFLQTKQSQYISSFSLMNAIGNGYIKSILKKIKLEIFFINKNQYKLLLNLIRCESHADVLKGVIEKFIKES